MKENNWINKLLGSLRLSHEMEEVQLIQGSIEKAVIFRGTNLWILIFGILVASVGLNMNSTAVVIGAMLISPLMGPINGVGYSVATYNLPLFRKSLVNFGFSAGAGLVTSALYFFLSPIHTEHSELLARTSPTIYDVLIALFGGLAGIIALTSKNKGNVLPGVAIATALMPPLCTAGYGISIGNWAYFLGAMYLFFINSVFIALAAMLVSQVLKLPRQTHLLSREIKNKNIAIAAVIALTVIPSIYLGYTLVQKEKLMSRVDLFLKDIGSWDGNYLLRHEVSKDLKSLYLVYAGNEFDESSLKRLDEKADDLGLGDLHLIVEQGFQMQDLNKYELERSASSSELENLRNSIAKKRQVIDSLEAIPHFGKDLLQEIKALYPSVHSCSYATTYRFIDSLNVSESVSIVLLSSSGEMEEDERVKIREWLKHRLKVKYVELKF